MPRRARADSRNRRGGDDDDAYRKFLKSAVGGLRRRPRGSRVVDVVGFRNTTPEAIFFFSLLQLLLLLLRFFGRPKNVRYFKILKQCTRRLSSNPLAFSVRKFPRPFISPHSKQPVANGQKEKFETHKTLSYNNAVWHCGRTCETAVLAKQR